MGDISSEPKVKKYQLALEIPFSFFCCPNYKKKHTLSTGYVKLNFLNIWEKNNVLLTGL